MLTGIYIETGTELYNQRALLRDDPDTEDCYLAQFDALFLRESHGWHRFPKKHFVNIQGGDSCGKNLKT